jgi:hypothetical protein
VQYTSRSGGAWTETGTKLPLMALVVTGLDTGGSAVVVNPEVATELGV